MTTLEFSETIEPLYRQFGWRMSLEDKARHMHDRYKVLQHFSLATLTLAVNTLLASESRMPPVSAIRQACLDSLRVGQTRRAPEKPHDDADSCACGCGGRRWCVEMPNGLTRDHLACRRLGADLPPSADPLRQDNRGVSIYSLAAATIPL